MNALFEQALGLQSPWYIESVDFSPEAKRLDIRVNVERGARFRFRDVDAGVDGEFGVYDTTLKSYRHLNFFEHECYLHAWVPRLDTPVGKRLITPPWAGLSSGFTLLFEALLMQMARHMPVSALGRLVNVSDYKLWSMLDRYVEGARAHEDYSRVSDIGVDETSLKRGHNYMTLAVDLKQRRTLFVTEGRDSSTIARLAEDLSRHRGSPENIRTVSADMSPAFAKGIAEHLPNAAITFDRFHVVKLVNEAVDEVRRSEVRTHPILKKKRYSFLKNWDNLTEEQRTEIEQLELSSLKLKTVRALHLRESFQDIYEADSVEEFELLLDKWYYWATHSRLEPFKKLARTIKAHRDGIVRWMSTKVTNGILEGFNSLIQAAKRKARGYSTTKTFTIIAYLLTGKLDFFPLNPNIQPT
jgi:transposase